MTIQEVKTYLQQLPSEQQMEIEQFVHECRTKEQANAWERVLLAIQEYEITYGDIIFKSPAYKPLVIEDYCKGGLGKLNLVKKENCE